MLEKLNIDSLQNLEDGPYSQRESRVLMKQITQMKGITKCISITLLVLSFIYLITRILSFFELRDYQERNSNKMIGSTALKYQNIQMLHYFTIAHSFTCVVISMFVFMMLRKNTLIDRRQYYFVLGITTLVTLLYFFSLLYIVFRSTQIGG